jgi:histidinol-phosphatase
VTSSRDPDGLLAELELAMELAQLGADIALPRFRDRDFTVTIKPDGSPVTDVDQAVEQALRSRIAEAHPDHAVTGEEYGATGDSDWRWYLDPIDGTKHYVAGNPLWMVLVALAHREQVQVGVVIFPVRGERWWAARGHGAFRDGEPIAVSRTARLRDAVVADDWRETLAKGITDHPLASLAARAGGILPHEGYNFLSVAAGRADVALGLGAFSWDYAPATVIVEEAGGRFTDFDGGPRFDARRAVVTNGLLHDEVLAALHE